MVLCEGPSFSDYVQVLVLGCSSKVSSPITKKKLPAYVASFTFLENSEPVSYHRFVDSS